MPKAHNKHESLNCRCFHKGGVLAKAKQVSQVCEVCYLNIIKNSDVRTPAFGGNFEENE